jgi:hypothetical protein
MRQVISSTLWGVIGGLIFGVLIFGYQLLTGSTPLGIVETLSITGLIVIFVAVTTYVMEPCLRAKGRV